MLLCAGGMEPLYLLDVSSRRATKITSLPGPFEEFEFTPDGRMVTYVADYNIWAIDLATLSTRPLTTAGTEAMRIATPDSLGELLWSNGYWWSPDSTRLAYLVTDESGVAQFAMQDLLKFAGGLNVQRYPLPGSGLPQAGVCVMGPTARSGSIFLNGQAGCWRRSRGCRIPGSWRCSC